MGQQPAQKLSADNPLIKVNHPRFANITAVRPPSAEDQGMIQSKMFLVPDKTYEIWSNKFEKVEKSRYLLLPDSHKYEGTDCCGSLGTVTSQYEHFPFVLKEEIENRRGLNQYFLESQMWFLVYSMVKGAVIFHGKGQKVGDIRPANVFINEDGEIKLASQASWPGETTNYSKRKHKKETTFLAPEELLQIKEGHQEQQPYNLDLKQSFSIGLTLLSAAVLMDCSSFYTQKSVNFSALDQALQALEDRKEYGEPLKLLIQSLCEMNPIDRVATRELNQWLTYYSDSIVELQDFEFNELPKKMADIRKFGRHYHKVRSEVVEEKKTRKYIEYQYTYETEME